MYQKSRRSEANRTTRAVQVSSAHVDKQGPFRRLLLVSAFALVILFAYSNSFQSGFVFDNSPLILQDVRIRAATPVNLGLILNQEYWYNHTPTGLYRPLTTLSYLFNYAILDNTDHPAGYHWINFALHAANIVMVYLVALLVLRKSAPAFAVAAVWALHPISTESVTNIVGRADLLAAFGVLGGLLCHVQAVAAGSYYRIKGDRLAPRQSDHTRGATRKPCPGTRNRLTRCCGRKGWTRLPTWRIAAVM